jgi:hypothetical protein
MFNDNDKLKEDCERALAIYTFADILEQNDLTEEEALLLLVENGFIELPGVLSV